MSRKSKTPRKADTYRGARRMEAKKGDLLDEWRAKAPVKLRPYQIKPPKIKMVTLPDGKVSLVANPRKQPKKYPYASTKRDGSIVSLWQAHEHDEAA